MRIILWVGYIVLIFSMTGRPCSYSPREAAWNQIVLSAGLMAVFREENTFFRPLIKSLILGLKRATILRRKAAKIINWL